MLHRWYKENKTSEPKTLDGLRRIITSAVRKAESKTSNILTWEDAPIEEQKRYLHIADVVIGALQTEE